jgi:hypothetical protein
MAGIEQRGGEPQQERRNISRREFFEYCKGALVGGVAVFSLKDGANTEQQLSQVRKEAEEELKKKGIHPPTEEEIQAEVRNSEFGVAIPETPTIRESIARKRLLRNYEDRVHDLVCKKDPLLVLENTLDKVGRFGAGIMIGHKLYKALSNEIRRK